MALIFKGLGPRLAVLAVLAVLLAGWGSAVAWLKFIGDNVARFGGLGALGDGRLDVALLVLPLMACAWIEDVGPNETWGVGSKQLRSALRSGVEVQIWQKKSGAPKSWVLFVNGPGMARVMRIMDQDESFEWLLITVAQIWCRGPFPRTKWCQVGFIVDISIVRWVL